jgi:hypothetical protein
MTRSRIVAGGTSKPRPVGTAVRLRAGQAKRPKSSKRSGRRDPRIFRVPHFAAAHSKTSDFIAAAAAFRVGPQSRGIADKTNFFGAPIIGFPGGRRPAAFNASTAESH